MARWTRSGAAAVLACAAFGQQTLQVGPNGISCGSAEYFSNCAGHSFTAQNACGRHQYILWAAELAAIPPGHFVTSIALNVTEAMGFTWQNVQFAMGHTTVSDFAPLGMCIGFSCPFPWLPTSTVRSAAPWTDAPGLNTFVLDAPFYWNGVDNVVVDVQWSQSGANTYDARSLGIETTIQYVANRMIFAKAVEGLESCPLAIPQVQDANRPVFRLGYCTAATAAPVGVGCAPGAASVPVLSGSPPFVGLPGTLSIAGATPFSGGILFLGREAPAPIGLPGGCLYRLTDDFLFDVFLTDAVGAWSYTAVVPNAAGLEVLLQALVLPAGGVPLLSTTNALRLTLGC